MIMHRLLLATAATVLALPLAAASPAPTYRVTGSIAGPDGAGWDYAKVDPGKHRLFVAHGDAVTVIDFADGGQARSIGALHRSHAVVPVPGTDLVAVTSGTDSTVRILDVATGAERASVAVGAKPDAALIDPGTGHLLTMDADGGTISELDLSAARVVRTIKVKPALEFAAIGANRMLYVNDEDANEVEVVDLRTGAVGAPIAMPGCEGPSGLALDAAHGRLIAACANGQVAVVDVHAHRLAQLVPIGQGPDAVMLDERRGVALIPCGKTGTLEVLSVAAAGKVTKLATVTTEAGARTGALDPTTGIVYLPTARPGPAPAGGGRPAPVPGTFHVVVVTPS